MYQMMRLPVEFSRALHKYLASSLCNQTIALSERWSRNLRDQGCDNVLRGQVYSTPQGAVKDECGADVDYWLTRENKRNSEKSMLYRHFVDDGFHHARS
jgi:hypothetical protein